MVPHEFYFFNNYSLSYWWRLVGQKFLNWNHSFYMKTNYRLPDFIRPPQYKRFSVMRFFHLFADMFILLRFSALFNAGLSRFATLFHLVIIVITTWILYLVTITYTKDFDVFMHKAWFRYRVLTYSINISSFRFYSCWRFGVGIFQRLDFFPASSYTNQTIVCKVGLLVWPMIRGFHKYCQERVRMRNNQTCVDKKRIALLLLADLFAFYLPKKDRCDHVHQPQYINTLLVVVRGQNSNVWNTFVIIGFTFFAPLFSCALFFQWLKSQYILSSNPIGLSHIPLARPRLLSWLVFTFSASSILGVHSITLRPYSLVWYVSLWRIWNP